MAATPTIPARYRDLLAALQRPGAYDHPAATVDHLHTHISDVFLAGDLAYKVKRPVDLGFLDFTTQEKRRHACEDEVRLNRRLAPDIYLGVSAVCQQEGRYYVSDNGCGADDTVDFAVRMRRLPQEGMLDRLAAAGRLTHAHLQDVAQQMARFHAYAERVPDYGRVAQVARPIDENFRQTEKYIDTCLTRAQFQRLRDYARGFLQTRSTLFEERIAAGRIVDGHGDLHLRNMCVTRERVVVFDCIEFNPALRAGDVINDIAFLTMDLDARGLPHLGNTFLNAYLEQTGDYPGMALLDFYQIYRAYVRGKVSALSMDAAQDPAERAAAQRDARLYFDLAERYLTARAPGLMITCGLSGSGKSTAARAAAAALGGVYVRADAVRKHLAGMALEQRDTSGYGQGIYNPQMSQRTYATLLDHARVIVASGRWAILDATYARREHRAPAAALARELGVTLDILYCDVPHEELLRRLAQRASAGTDVSDADAAVLEQQRRHFQVPESTEGRLLSWKDDATLRESVRSREH